MHLVLAAVDAESRQRIDATLDPKHWLRILLVVTVVVAVKLDVVLLPRLALPHPLKAPFCIGDMSPSVRRATYQYTSMMQRTR